MKSASRILLVILGMFCMALPALAQPGTWAWMHGPQTGGGLGTFGTKGVPAATNMPPALYECAHWTDHAGNFWLFGGMRGNILMYAAMWKFDPTTNQWTWMNGPQGPSTAGVYGTQGVPAPGNHPGSRSYGPNCWVDNNGDLWLFGGYGRDRLGVLSSLSDLWKYDIATNQWTWMSGPSLGDVPPVTGTMGVANPANFPPVMTESNCTWVDASNNLWVFGGTDDLFLPLDQVWRYNTSTNEWTWMKGNLTTAIPPTYGIQGVPAPSNNPGSRGTYAAWRDNYCDFWMFGGTNFDGRTFGDVWKFDPNTLEWTWMAGSDVPNTASNFSTYCSPSTSTFPGSRFENRTIWTDSRGRFWGFGGSPSFTNPVCVNDLWSFEPWSLEFTWVSGSLLINPPAVYGTLGTSAPSNIPSGRIGSISFQDAQGNFWMFGGYEWGTGQTMSDLWRYIPDPQCSPGAGVGLGGNPSAAFTAQPTTGCAPLYVSFTNGSSSASSYSWDFDDGGLSSAANPTHIFTNPGSYDVMLIALGGCLTTPDTSFLNIVVDPDFTFSLGPDLTTCTGDSLLLDAGNPGATYLWSNNSTAQTLNVQASGTYWAQVTNANGCVHRDSIVVSVVPMPFSLGPDPAICMGSTLTLDAGNPGSTYLWSNGDQTQTSSVTTGGNYWVEVISPAGCIMRDTVAVTLLPLPWVNLGPDSNICEGVPFMLDAGNHPSASFLWSNNGSSQTISVSATGLYWVQVTDSAGCQSRDSMNVSFAPLSVAVLGPDSTVCAGSSLSLDAGNPGSTYLWSNGDQTQTTSVSTSGTHWVQITLPSGCIAHDTVALALMPLPVVDLGPDRIGCDGATILLDGGNQLGASLLWSNNASSQSISVSTSGLYWMQVTDSLGCQSRDSITVTLDPIPVVTLGQDSIFCAGDSLSLDAGYPGSAFLWSTGEVTQAITVTQAGSYSVEITTPGGCIASGNILVAVIPDFVVELGPDTTFCKEKYWPLSSGHPLLSHLWSTGQQTASILARESGIYYVQVTSPCFMHADSIRLTFLSDSTGPFIPNVFTPNGDGINDILLVSGEHANEEFTMQVFDRWGRRLFTSNDARFGWDGTLNGMGCPDGVYFMWVQVIDCGGTFVRETTSVTLIR